MYTKSAAYYDAIYAFKDYRKEADVLLNLIGEHLRSDGNHLLDVACGTGKHIDYLKENFEVEGLDLEPEILKIAAERHPDIPLHQGDMKSFDLGKKFDVVTCLFSSIGYMTTLDDLGRAIANMARHLLPGGILIVEPWFPPSVWSPNTVHLQTVDEPTLKIARMVTSLIRDRLAVMEMHHLVGTPEKTEHFMERHEMLLATSEELLDAFRAAGLEATYVEEGLTKRGLVVGRTSRDM